ncbi:hypothetical protein NG798_09140 [Ancylothrix sp. C2]|uniref:hypothetical protein n=1 Tax=Ancylothrix sp. D3o TaxID=2953691 RepID=UPI0021BAA0E7|nr:hypothetical protein [Ancylothrix sp. D3o]MCT7949949.1 hypothetical protein [Ancylothrix sp. D3o]
MRNFSISVYFFHLYQTIAESLDRVSPEADLIWENVIQVSEKLPFTELKNLKSQLLCYELDKESKVFKHKTEALNLINIWLTQAQKPITLTTIKQNELEISGNLKPFLLHDTYAFDLTLYPEDVDQDITAEKLNLFQPSSLFLDCSATTLGETIWLFGEPELEDKEGQDLADIFVKEFLKSTKFTARFVAEGKLLKVPLFEYEISQDNQPNKRYKILVWIDNKAIDPEITPIYDDLIASLWTRHKIEYVYEQARDSYSKARKVYSELEDYIKKFKQNQPLEELQKILESMPELSIKYQRQMRDLQAHYTTIKVNQINYQNYLKKFWQSGDISTWQEFGETTCKRYLDQIETYINYIQPGKELIKEFINTLRGLVEVEQAKIDRSLQKTLQDNEAAEKERDRQLQTTVAVVGVGIGVAGVTATALPYYMKPPDKPQEIQLYPWNSPPHQITQAIGISLGVGSLPFLGWLLIYVVGRVSKFIKGESAFLGFSRKPKTIKPADRTQP